MIRTSQTHYITLNKIGYENQIAIPTGKKEGDTIEVLCFMSRNSERLVWIRRDEISTGEYVKQMKLI